jgi:hypothetical protein
MVVAALALAAMGALCVLGVILLGISLARTLRLARRRSRWLRQQDSPCPPVLADPQALRDRLDQFPPAVRPGRPHPEGQLAPEHRPGH